MSWRCVLEMRIEDVLNEDWMTAELEPENKPQSVSNKGSTPATDQG